jgi:hypothetical protein
MAAVPRTCFMSDRASICGNEYTLIDMVVEKGHRYLMFSALPVFGTEVLFL